MRTDGRTNEPTNRRTHERTKGQIKRMNDVILCVAGDLKATGIVRPLNREIYKPMLKRLKAEGIQSETTTTVL